MEGGEHRVTSRTQIKGLVNCTSLLSECQVFLKSHQNATTVDSWQNFDNRDHIIFLYLCFFQWLSIKSSILPDIQGPQRSSSIKSDWPLCCCHREWGLVNAALTSFPSVQTCHIMALKIIDGVCAAVPFLLAKATRGKKSLDVKKPWSTVRPWKISALLACGRPVHKANIHHTLDKKGNLICRFPFSCLNSNRGHCFEMSPHRSRWTQPWTLLLWGLSKSFLSYPGPFHTPPGPHTHKYV